MGPVVGLHGHIRRNMTTSRLLIASFFAAMCVCWVLVCVSYNATFRYFVGEQAHVELMASNGTFSSINASNRGDASPANQRTTSSASQPDGLPIVALVVLGATFAVSTLFIPVLFTLAWLAHFWWSNGSIVRWATGARSVSRAEERTLYNIVERFSIQTGEPMPRIELIESKALNAYAYGLTPSDSAIGVTRGLLQKLNTAELEAVIAHEYTHIRNRDSRVMVIASVFVGLFESLFHYFLSGITGAHENDGQGPTPARQFQRSIALVFGGLVIFGAMIASIAVCWLPSMLARAKLSRSREFLADAGAVELTKDPDALVAALLRIQQCNDVLAVAPALQAMMISGKISGLLASHPPVEDRVTALRAFAGALLPTRRPSMARAMLADGSPRAFGRRVGMTPVARG